MYHFRNITAKNSRQLSIAPKKQFLHQSSNNNTVHSAGIATTNTNTTVTSNTNTSTVPLVSKRRLVYALTFIEITLN